MFPVLYYNYSHFSFRECSEFNLELSLLRNVELNGNYLIVGKRETPKGIK